MHIDTLFMDHGKYLITIDEVPIGTEPVTIGEAIIIKGWLQKNTRKLQAIYEQKGGWEIIEQMKLWTETRRNQS